MVVHGTLGTLSERPSPKSVGRFWTSFGFGTVLGLRQTCPYPEIRQPQNFLYRGGLQVPPRLDRDGAMIQILAQQNPKCEVSNHVGNLVGRPSVAR